MGFIVLLPACLHPRRSLEFKSLSFPYIFIVLFFKRFSVVPKELPSEVAQRHFIGAFEFNFDQDSICTYCQLSF